MSKPWKAFLLSMALMCGASIAAMGQEQEQVPREFELENLVVTATRIPQEPAALPVSVSVIDREKIERSNAKTVTELLSREPGIFVVETGSLTIPPTRFNVRGFGGMPTTGVLVLIDGRPDIMGLMGHPMPDSLQLDNVERIEVVRGPASVLYGSGALGGVVNVITKGHEMVPRPRTTLSIGQGRFGAKELALATTGAGSRLGYRFTFSDRSADGFRPHCDFDSQNYTLHLQTANRPGWRTRLDAKWIKYAGSDPMQLDSPKPPQFRTFKRGGIDLTFDRHTARGTRQVHLYRNFGTHEFPAPDGWTSHDYTDGLIFTECHSLPERPLRLSFGADLKRYGGDADNDLKARDYGSHRGSEVALFGIAEQRLASSSRLSAGLRLDKAEGYSWQVCPSAGFVKQHSRGLSTRLNVAKGFRIPCMRELELPYFPSNPELRPESVWNYEAGLHRDYPNGSSLDVAAFVARGDNLIRWTWSPELGRGIYQNTGPFKHKGVEIAYCTPVGDESLFSANYSWLDPANHTWGSPAGKLNLGWDFTRLPFRASFDLQHVHKLYGSDNHENRLPDYLVGSCKLRWQAAQQTEYFVAIDNLFNTNYEVAAGYPMPPRSFSVGLSSTF